MIYLTMLLGVVLIELGHLKYKKYPSAKEWFYERWDNLSFSLISGIALCIVFPELSTIGFVQNVVDIHQYPSLGGIIIGLSSTPLINFIKSKTKDKLKSS